MSSSSSSDRGYCRFIPLDEIKDATDNFNESYVLGQGGESKVYLAKIKLGWNITQVAVKHLKPNSQEFDKEIQIISKIQHPNLVSLLGYCDESGQKILLYEFMEKGSLSDYLKKRSSSISLSWLQRLRICLDAARGLQHLHVETDENSKGIIHRDVKPDNILLGKDWVAKISDFGLFKLSNAGQKNSTMITLRKGTSGYFAPEYLAYNSVTRKVDVYAFGVVLFQVLCLKMPWDRGDESYYEDELEDLGVWAQQNIDPKIESEICDDSIKGFTAIIGKSLKRDPKKRPTMDGVVLELEKVLKCQEREDEAKKVREPHQHSTAGSCREAHSGRKVSISGSVLEECSMDPIQSIQKLLINGRISSETTAELPQSSNTTALDNDRGINMAHWGSGYSSGYGRRQEEPTLEYGSGYGRKQKEPTSEYGSGYGRKQEEPTSEYGSGYGRKEEPVVKYGSGYGRKQEYGNPSSEFGSGYGRKQEYGNPSSEYGSGYGRKTEYEEPSSEYGSGYGRKPASQDYGSGYGRKSEYEEPSSEYGSGYGRKMESSEYGSGYGRRPSYGEEQEGGGGYGGAPSYGKLSYGRNEEESYPKPSYGRRDDYEQQGYGRKKYGDETSDDEADEDEERRRMKSHHRRHDYDD